MWACAFRIAAVPLTFYGQDPILPTPIRFGTMAAVGIAARSVAVAALWRARDRRGSGHLPRRSQGTAALLWILRWQMGDHQRSRAYRRGRSLTIPSWRCRFFRRNARTADMSCVDTSIRGCAPSASGSCAAATASTPSEIAIPAVASRGVGVRSGRGGIGSRHDPRRRRRCVGRYSITEVLAKTPLITLERIADSEPVPFGPDAQTPLEGIRALGMGHVIAGAALGRGLGPLRRRRAEHLEIERL